MNYKLQFAELLPYWDVLLQGLIFTIVLTVVSTVAGIARRHRRRLGAAPSGRCGSAASLPSMSS